MSEKKNSVELKNLRLKKGIYEGVTGTRGSERIGECGNDNWCHNEEGGGNATSGVENREKGRKDFKRPVRWN